MVVEDGGSLWSVEPLPPTNRYIVTSKPQIKDAGNKKSVAVYDTVFKGVFGSKWNLIIRRTVVCSEISPARNIRSRTSGSEDGDI